MTTHVCVVHRTLTRHVHEANDQVGVFKRALCGSVPKEPHYDKFPMERDCRRCDRISKMIIDKSIRANPTYPHMNEKGGAMKPIRWRWRDGFRHANVEGVKVRVGNDWNDYYVRADYPNDDLQSERVSVSIPNGMPKRCIDAAAYALANLVQTLRGME